MRRSGSFLLALGLCWLATTTQAAAPQLEIDMPWIAAGPPQVPVLAGYLRLRNPGRTPLQVVAVHSPQFAAVEMHQTQTGADGMSRMRRLAELHIEAGATLSLEPGGRHLMLLDPKTPLRAGDTVELVFELATGPSVTVQAPVRERGAGAGPSHSHHDHH